jgi:hypothetical protein
MSSELVIDQRKLGHSRKFQFAHENLIYTLRDPSGERTFSVPYQIIDASNVSEVRSTNPRFVQRLNRAAIVGFVASFAIASVSNPAGAVVGISSVIAFVGIWAAHSMGLFSVSFTHIPMSPVPAGAKSNLLSIIKDDRRDQVVAELRKRSHDRLRALYGTANLAGNPEQEAGRLKWLKDRDVISDREYEEQMSRLRSLQHTPQAPEEASLN